MNGKGWFTAREEIFHGRVGERRITVRPMHESEAGIAMELQRRVWRLMPDPSMLAETDMDEIRESARLDICLGAFDGVRLAAFALMVVNRESARRNAGQKNGCDPLESVTFDTVFVDPDYRGLGLQRYLFREMEGIAREIGAKYAFATVAPQNAYSLQNMQACGFEIVARKLLYGSRDRYIMMKKLNCNEKRS